jgi:hypothetical protein
VQGGWRKEFLWEFDHTNAVAYLERLPQFSLASHRLHFLAGLIPEM